jgi:hypothetical protein
MKNSVCRYCGHLFILFGICIGIHAQGANVDGPSLTGMAPNPLMIHEGETGILTITLDGPALGDTSVTVTSSDPSVASVNTATISNGQMSGSVSVAGLVQGETQIIATLGDSAVTGIVTVLSLSEVGAPLVITGLLPYPLTVAQGNSTSMTVTLSAAVDQDTVVVLSSSAPQIASVLGSVTVMAGQSSVSFLVQALSAGTANISAGFGTGFTFLGVVEVQPPPPPPPSTCALASTNAATAAQAYASPLLAVGTTCTPSASVKNCRQAIASAAAANKSLAQARAAMLLVCRPGAKAH